MVSFINKKECSDDSGNEPVASVFILFYFIFWKLPSYLESKDNEFDFCN